MLTRPAVLRTGDRIVLAHGRHTHTATVTAAEPRSFLATCECGWKCHAPQGAGYPLAVEVAS